MDDGQISVKLRPMPIQGVIFYEGHELITGGGLYMKIRKKKYYRSDDKKCNHVNKNLIFTHMRATFA